MNIETLIKPLSNLYNEKRDQNILAQIEKVLHEYILQTPNDYEAFLRLAITIFSQTNNREDEAIEVLQMIPPTSIWYAKSALIEAYMQEEVTQIDQSLCKKLLALQTPDNEIKSMKYYMTSSYFIYRNEQTYQYMLKKSVKLCNKHVWNLVTLARIYRIYDTNKCKMLICDALDNIEFVGFGHKPDEDITNVDYFIKSYISGVYLTTFNFKDIINDLRPVPHKMPWEK